MSQTHRKVTPAQNQGVDSTWLVAIGGIGVIFILVAIFAAFNDDGELFPPPRFEDGTVLAADMPLYLLEDAQVAAAAGQSTATDEESGGLATCQEVQAIASNDGEFFHLNAVTNSYWVHVKAADVGVVGWLPVGILSNVLPLDCPAP